MPVRGNRAGIINGREIPAAQQKPMLLSTGVRVESHNLARRTDVLSACGDSARKIDGSELERGTRSSGTRQKRHCSKGKSANQPISVHV